MSDIISEIILEELRHTRREMNEGFTELRQRSTAIEAHTEPFFETDGGLDKIEAEIQSLQKTKYIALGGAGILSGGLHWFLHKLGV